MSACLPSLYCDPLFCLSCTRTHRRNYCHSVTPSNVQKTRSRLGHQMCSSCCIILHFQFMNSLHLCLGIVLCCFTFVYILSFIFSCFFHNNKIFSVNFFLVFLRLHLRHLEVPRPGVEATGLHDSHSNARSKPHLQPMPQLTATLDP